MPAYLYHYTTEEGAIGIQSDGYIEMSEDTNRDAILGEGVYLTDLPPDTDDETLLANNYGAAAPGQEDKITWYIRIRKSDLPGVKKKRFGSRVIYVYPSDIDLEDVSYKIKKRS